MNYTNTSVTATTLEDVYANLPEYAEVDDTTYDLIVRGVNDGWFGANRNNGLCHCGCGRYTRLAAATSEETGHIKGLPLRFINGHNARGNSNPNWRGGRRVDTNGYVRITVPKSHPLARKNSGGSNTFFVYEHRYVTYSGLNGGLTVEMDVHHRNEQKSDNRLINLIAFSNKSSHTTHHAHLRRGLSEVESLRLLTGRFIAFDEDLMEDLKG